MQKVQVFLIQVFLTLLPGSSVEGSLVRNRQNISRLSERSRVTGFSSPADEEIAPDPKNQF
jgi:hypothetical protein